MIYAYHDIPGVLDVGSPLSEEHLEPDEGVEGFQSPIGSSLQNSDSLLLELVEGSSLGVQGAQNFVDDVSIIFALESIFLDFESDQRSENTHGDVALVVLDTEEFRAQIWHEVAQDVLLDRGGTETSQDLTDLEFALITWIELDDFVILEVQDQVSFTVVESHVEAFLPDDNHWRSKMIRVEVLVVKFNVVDILISLLNDFSGEICDQMIWVNGEFLPTDVENLVIFYLLESHNVI